MIAAVLAGPRRLELREVQDPEPDGESVVIEVSACGVCGSDLHYWDMGLDMTGRPGLIPGHEFSGTVVDAGARTDLAPGDPVTVIPLDPCGACRACLSGRENLCIQGARRRIPANTSPGALARFVSVRPDMVRRLPSHMDAVPGALVEPSAVALRAVRRSGLRRGESVCVTGAGPIGLLSAAWAKVMGASVVAVTEPNPVRRSFASESGLADHAFDALDQHVATVMKKVIGGPFDRAIETSGTPGGIHTAASALATGGTLVMAGVSFEPVGIMTAAFLVKEIDARSTLGYSLREFETAMDAVAAGTLDARRIVTRTVPLEDVQEAFEDLSSGTSRDVKVVVRIA
ncbi:MAG TPA: alcohol dehydrogenase catalytic domain-containing protein [Deltaproteobacteria bacterium]|nr:alcohol dehydrogenase catalytic domain-containing protein [Deltaproteobacteria bacterium]